MASSAGKPPSTTTTTTSVRAYHVLRIDGYSRTFETLSNNQSMDSCPFRAGGYTWVIRFFPKAKCGDTNFLSFYLALVDVVDDEVVAAEATFSLLDQDQKPVPSYSATTGTVDISKFGLFGGYGFKYFIRNEDLERSEFLKDDCFAVRVDVHIVKQVPVPPMPELVPPSHMHRHLGGLLSSKLGADVEFLVGGETFAAHRLVLGARSPVFKAELSVPTTTKEKGAAATTTSAVIEIEDMEAPVFRAMLAFIYTDTWPDMDHGQDDESAMARRLLAAADRYGIQRLKLMCEDWLCGHIDTGSVAAILALAEKHRCAVLKKACLEFLGSSAALFAAIGTEEFENLALSCPNITKELICNVIARNKEGKAVVWNQESNQDSVITCFSDEEKCILM